MRLIPCQWLKVGLRPDKWLLKKSLNKLWILFQCFYCRFWQERKYGIFSNVVFYNATDQAIAMDRYQSDFWKLDNSFSTKQKDAERTDHMSSGKPKAVGLSNGCCK